MSGPTPSLWEVFKSVCASFFGVQNEATRRRDFTYGKPGQFILIGLILTLILIGGLFLIVQLALYLALAE